MAYIQFSEQIPEKQGYDVIVAGAGVAGIAAAVAARRAGKSVLLLEKATQLGGLATIGLINYFVPMCNGRGVQIIKGLCDEFIDLSIRDGFDTLPEVWKERKDHPTKEKSVRFATQYSPTIFSLALTDLIVSEGITLLVDCVAANPVMDGTHCKGVIIQGKAGREYYPCGVVVDATGDSDLLERAGVPTVLGKNYFSYFGSCATLESCERVTKSRNIHDLYSGISGGNINLYGDRQPADVPLYKGVTPEEVSDYTIRNQRLMLKNLREKYPDRFSREIISLPIMPQFRTTRRIDGDYTLSADDAFKHFDDSVCAVNDFDRSDYLYEVPYRTLVHHSFDNLITAGRSAAGEGYAWDILRVIPPAILTGQAAGEAAALALEEKTAIASVTIPELQRRLANNKMMIHFDDALIPPPEIMAEAEPVNNHF